MKPHYWSRCPMCGPIVICGKCGNNCCSGGYGALADGSPCAACPGAYEKQDASDGLPLWGRVLNWWSWVDRYVYICRQRIAAYQASEPT